MIMAPTNDAPVTVEPSAELADMLVIGTETGAFDHTPEEIGLHVMENAQAILNALDSAPAGDGVEDPTYRELIERVRWIVEAPGARDKMDRMANLTRHDMRRILAALARPRAVVGEREAIARLIYSWHPHVHSGRTDAAIADGEPLGTQCLADWHELSAQVQSHWLERADAILALQSPPPKVEGEPEKESTDG